MDDDPKFAAIEDEDTPGEPDRDEPADGLGDSEGSDQLMDADVLERAQRSAD